MAWLVYSLVKLPISDVESQVNYFREDTVPLSFAPSVPK